MTPALCLGRSLVSLSLCLSLSIARSRTLSVSLPSSLTDSGLKLHDSSSYGPQVSGSQQLLPLLARIDAASSSLVRHQLFMCRLRDLRILDRPSALARSRLTRELLLKLGTPHEARSREKSLRDFDSSFNPITPGRRNCTGDAAHGRAQIVMMALCLLRALAAAEVPRLRTSAALTSGADVRR